MVDPIQKAFSPRERNSEAMVSFGFRLNNQFGTNKMYRRPKELEWIKSLRQVKGIHDPEVKIEPGNSKVYPKITRSKVNIVLSRLHEMLFPDKDSNFTVDPTPEPRLAKETVTKIAKSLVETDEESGELVIPTAEELNLAIKKYSKKTSEKMFNVIWDQFVEMDYSEETKKVLKSGLTYGTGVLKGPMISKRVKRTWHPVSGGDYEERVEDEDVPHLEFVRLWDWYPDMSVTDHDKGEGDFQRHIMTKHDLRKLMKRKDFYSDMIKSVIEQHPNGNYVPLNWEVDLQVIEVEAQGDGEEAVTSATSSDDFARSTDRQLGKKYEVLEYWGYVDGADLAACGVEVEDVSLEYAANVWLLNKRPIKAALFDAALNQYKVFYYEKDETSVFGEGLPKIMRDSQLAIAAGARMVLDNGAVVAGPQIEVNWSLMTPDTDLNSIYPRKIWFREGKGIDAQYPAVRVYNIDSHVDELLKIIDAFKQFGDEETTLPTWLIGQMANNETAQATSGRMSMITVSIKDIVKNFDAFTEKVVRDMYAWNMEFNPRNDIKGDFTCRARGVSSLVMKEIRMQAMSQMTSTMTEEEWGYIPTREFLQEKFKAHDLDVTLLSEEEVSKNRTAEQQSEQAMLTLAMQKAELEYKKAQTMAQLSKAKKSNTEAVEIATREEEGAESESEAREKAEEGRRREEAHQLDQQIKKEKHDVDITTTAVKTANEVEGRNGGEA